VFLLIGATGIFAEIQDALNTIWEVRSNEKSGLWNLIKTRGLSFSMVLVIGFLLLVSLVLSAALAGLVDYVKAFFSMPAISIYIVDVLVSLGITSVLFAMMFKILPDVAIAWSDVWVGAAMTALLFTVGKFIVGFYIGKAISASSFGAAGSLVLVISWTYYSAFLLYFGAEFTRVYASRSGSLAATWPPAA
jgi:membrane protein